MARIPERKSNGYCNKICPRRRKSRSRSRSTSPDSSLSGNSSPTRSRSSSSSDDRQVRRKLWKNSSSSAHSSISHGSQDSEQYEINIEQDVIDIPWGSDIVSGVTPLVKEQDRQYDVVSLKNALETEISYGHDSGCCEKDVKSKSAAEFSIINSSTDSASESLLDANVDVKRGTEKPSCLADVIVSNFSL
jgi:hypothetical protein